jgi:hypothetical protein
MKNKKKRILDRPQAKLSGSKLVFISPRSIIYGYFGFKKLKATLF